MRIGRFFSLIAILLAIVAAMGGVGINGLVGDRVTGVASTPTAHMQDESSVLTAARAADAVVSATVARPDRCVGPGCERDEMAAACIGLSTSCPLAFVSVAPDWPDAGLSDRLRYPLPAAAHAAGAEPLRDLPPPKA